METLQIKHSRFPHFCYRSSDKLSDAVDRIDDSVDSSDGGDNIDDGDYHTDDHSKNNVYDNDYNRLRKSLAAEL